MRDKIEIRKISNGFIVESDYLDEETYFKTFEEVRNCIKECLDKFEEENKGE